MDLKKLTSALLSSDSIEGLSGAAGVSSGDVTSVLKEALPTLLNGASEQAKSKETSKSFADALSKHAKDDTNDLAGFLGNVDLEDGAKIIGHLLGSGSKKTTSSIAKKAGVSNDKTAAILSAAAPLLMSLLGQQADEDEDKDSGVEAMIGSLLSNVDVGELLTGLLTDNSTTTKKKSSKKKAKSSDSSDLIGGLLKTFLK